jgi:hypothetical protein
MNNPRSSVGCGGNPAGRPMPRLGIRPALSAERAEATPGNDCNGAPSKLRVCFTPVFDAMTTAAALFDTMEEAAVDTMTTVAVDTTTAVEIYTTTTVVVDTTIAGGGRNSLSTKMIWMSNHTELIPNHQLCADTRSKN